MDAALADFFTRRHKIIGQYHDLRTAMIHRHFEPKDRAEAIDFLDFMAAVIWGSVSVYEFEAWCCQEDRAKGGGH